VPEKIGSDVLSSKIYYPPYRINSVKTINSDRILDIAKEMNIKAKLKTVSLHSLKPSLDSQKIERKVVKRMKKEIAYSNGDFPPLIIASDGKTILEGNHRYRSYKALGIKRVKVIVTDISKHTFLPSFRTIQFFSRLQKEGLV